jgi:dihydrofolate reductase
MTLSILVAVAENGIIGREGRLPWRLPDDLRRFKRLTTGHAIVMGRRTYESIGRALPGRRSVVLSRDGTFAPHGVEIAGSLDAALSLCAGEEEVFVIGGESLFREALPRAQRLYLPRVHAELPGDVSFPPLDESLWVPVESEPHAADEQHPHPFTFFTYHRRG